MTALEQAQQYIDTTQYAKFFALMHQHISDKNLLASLQKVFIAGKATADFPEQLHVLVQQHKDRLSALSDAQNALPSATFLTYCPTRQVFIGRQGELLKLHTYLEVPEAKVVVHGLGGIGKTSLACEYVKQYEHTYTHIVWLVQNSSLLSTFIDCYDLNKDFTFTQEPETIRFQMVLKKLSECAGKNLLVVDNFQAHHLDKTLCTLSYFNTAQMRDWKILFTSREKVADYQHLDLDILPEEEAITLFRKHCTERKVGENDLKALLYEIGYHTLLIELLAKVYNTNHDLKNLPALTAKMQQKALHDQDLQDETWTAHSQEEIALYDYLLRIFKIEALDENARYVLKQLAVLPAEAQEYERFLDWIGDETHTHRKTLKELEKKGWLACPQQRHYQMHRLIQMLMFKILQPTYQDCATLHNTVGELLDLDKIEANPLEAQWLIRYGEFLLQHIDYQTDLKNKIYLQNQIGFLYDINGNYAQALPLFEKALQICKKVLGEKHLETAGTLNNLAKVYKSQGHYAQAFSFYEQSLQILQETLEEKNPYIATCLNNIAILYYNQNNYTKAFPLLEQALLIRKEVLGEKHPDTAQSLNNIAMLHKNQGNYAQAFPLLEQALQIRQEVLEEKHPDIANSLYNISELYFEIRQYDKAKSLVVQAYQIWQEILGEEHPHTQQAKKNLAFIIQVMQEGENL